MNFSIAVKLIEQGVQQGANRIKQSLLAIQLQALALASALSGGVSGLSDLLQKMVDTARETSRVQTALKNVSSDQLLFSQHLGYLKKLTQEYGLEINGTTSAFTKFTAAASAAGMSLEDQQKVFSAISRSISAFSLSGDEATLTFYAVSQMMAKGKISAEELRRQLGERMPIAMEAMSRAAKKMGFKENLDDLLKGGKLNSLAILPKFAEELNNLVVSVDTDNAETSVNRLKNSFAELVESWDITGKFKTIVDAIRSFVDSLKDSVSGLSGAVGGLLGGKLFNSVAGHISTMMKNVRDKALAEQANLKKELEQADATFGATQKNLDKVSDQHSLEVAKARSLEARKHAEAQNAVNQALAQEKALQDSLVALDKARTQQVRDRRIKENELSHTKRNVYDDYVRSVPEGGRVDSYQTWLSKRERALENHRATSIKLEQDYHNQRLKLEQELAIASDKVAQKRLEAQTKVSEATKKANQTIATSQARLTTAQEAHNKSITAQRTAHEALSNSVVQGTGRMTIAKRLFGVAINSVKASIQSMLASFLPMLIIGGIISIITKINEMTEAWDASKRAMEEYQTGLAMAGNSEELSRLERAIKLLENKNAKESDIAQTKKYLNDYLDTEITDTDTLIEKAKQRLDLERKIASAKYADKEIIEAEYKIREFEEQRKAKGLPQITDQHIKIFSDKVENSNVIQTGAMVVRSWLTPDSGLMRDIEKDQKRSEKILRRNHHEQVYGLELARGNESISSFYKDIARYKGLKETLKQAEADYNSASGEVKKEVQRRQSPIRPSAPTENETNNQSTKPKLTPLQQTEKEWQEESRELLNQLKVGAITQEEYNEALNKLKEAISKKIAGILGKSSEQNATYQATKDYYKEYKPTEGDKIRADYSKERGELDRQKQEGLIDEEAYKQAMHDLSRKTLERLVSLGELTQLERAMANTLKQSISRGGEYTPNLPKREERDRTMDYKRSDAEKLELDKRSLDDYIRDLESGKTALNGWGEELERMQVESRDLDKAIKIAIIRDDVKKLQRELGGLKWSSFKNATQTISTLSSNIKRMYETLQDDNVGGLEKMMSVIEGMTSSIDSILTLIEQIGKLSEMFKTLGAAQEALATAQQSSSKENTQALAQEIALSNTKTNTEVANSGIVQGIKLSEAIVAKNTSAEKVSANAAEGASEVGKKAAISLPFPFNLVAMAGAIAGAIALFRNIPKFASGGIVPGNSRSGDRVLAGVNSGELILNEAQQHNIASKLIKGAGEPVSVDVHIKERLRGNDLRRSVSRSTRSSQR